MWFGFVLLALAYVALLSPALALAQPVHYGASRWDMRDGLPHNLVHSIAQDRQGFIWAATWEGVLRFNGRSFTVFDNENTEEARLSGVFSLLAEADGSILAGTAFDGIYRHDQGQWAPYGGSGLRSLLVEDMRRTGDGTLWLSSRSQLLRVDAQGQPQPVAFPEGIEPGQIHGLYDDADTLLVASVNGAWQVRDGKATPWGQAQGFAGKQVRQISRDGDGGWLVACSDGVWHWQADG
ncbi:MAG: two-component regulator propeller domain-containing protein, partial [Stenotrophomonas koreensis]